MHGRQIAGSGALLSIAAALAWGWAQSPARSTSGQEPVAEDSAFAALQGRGEQAMGVDQYTSTHLFDALPDGGRIELQRDVDDSAGVATIREHLAHIAKAFGSGDFTTPAFVHLREVPGAEVMAAKGDAIEYTYADLPRGGELRLVTSDPEALEAIHEFMAFQREEHRAGGAAAGHHGPHERMPHTGTGHGRTGRGGEGGKTP